MMKNKSILLSIILIAFIASGYTDCKSKIPFKKSEWEKMHATQIVSLPENLGKEVDFKGKKLKWIQYRSPKGAKVWSHQKPTAEMFRLIDEGLQKTHDNIVGLIQKLGWNKYITHTDTEIILLPETSRWRGCSALNTTGFSGGLQIAGAIAGLRDKGSRIELLRPVIAAPFAEDLSKEICKTFYHDTFQNEGEHWVDINYILAGNIQQFKHNSRAGHQHPYYANSKKQKPGKFDSDLSQMESFAQTKATSMCGTRHLVEELKK